MADLADRLRVLERLHDVHAIDAILLGGALLVPCNGSCGRALDSTPTPCIVLCMSVQQKGKRPGPILAVRVTPKQQRLLKQASVAEGRTVSGQVRWIIDRHFENTDKQVSS